MIEKIKGFAHLREDLTAVLVQMEHNKRELKEMTDIFKAEMEQIKEFRNVQVEFLNQMKSDLADMQQVKVQLTDEVDKFRSLNKQTQKGIIERFEREVRDSLISHSKELQLDKSNYEKIREQIEITARNVFLANAELNKFVEISKELKQADFQLAKYAESLRKEDRNKLELMQKIDQLERLIAKMRRQG